MSVVVINIENGSIISNQNISVNLGDEVEFSNDSDCGVTVSFREGSVPFEGFKNPLILCGKSKEAFTVGNSKAGQSYGFKCKPDDSSFSISAKEPDGSIIIND